MSSPPVFSGVRVTRSLVLYICFVDRCLSFYTFSFHHCVVCSSVFWPLCCLFFCLLAIVLSGFLSFGHCVVCSSVFWPLCCLFFCLLAIVLSVLLSFGHCVVCSSSIYGFWLPLWYLQTLLFIVSGVFLYDKSCVLIANMPSMYMNLLLLLKTTVCLLERCFRSLTILIKR